MARMTMKQLAVENQALRAENSVLRTELETLKRGKRDVSTLSTIRERMLAAKAEALRTGRVVRVTAPSLDVKVAA